MAADSYPHPARETQRALFAVSLTAVVLLVPAALNGGPFLFYDSEEYFQVGARMFDFAFGGDPPVSEAPPDTTGVGGDVGDTESREGDGGGLSALAGARSPIYSSVLYASVKTVGLWGIALAQAIVCAWLLVRFTMFAWGPVGWRTTLGVAAAVCVLSGLGFYAAFIMPDVFAGCTLLAAVLLIFARPGRTETFVLAALVALGASLHGTNLPLLGMVVAGSVALKLGARERLGAVGRQLLPVIIASVAAALFNFSYSAVVRAATGSDARAMPYMMARVIADGPGARYLNQVCKDGATPFVACVFAGRAFENSDAVLWKPAGEGGGLLAVTPSVRAQLKDEETRFVAAVLSSNPWEQVAASLGNFGAQLTKTGLGELNSGLGAMVQDAYWRESGVIAGHPSAIRCLASQACEPPGWQDAWSALVGLFNVLVLPLTGIAAGAIFFLRGRPRLIPAKTVDLARIAAVLALAAIGNAAICGVLSGAFDRYQARLMWTVMLGLTALAPTLWIFVRSPALTPRS